MNSDKLGVTVEKLNEHNFHTWKQKIALVLAYREVDAVLTTPKPKEGTAEQQAAWARNDNVARAIIGLSLSDSMLEHVRDLSTASEMFESIKNVFQRHTLLNKLRARREFYTATMKSNEKMLVYINRVTQLSSILKSMEVTIDDAEVAMAVLNGLPAKFGNIITALDALGDERSLSLELVKSRLLQEEQRDVMRSAASDSLLINEENGGGKRAVKCTHCNRTGHPEQKCWDKYPHLRPEKFRKKAKHGQALAAQKDVEDVEDDSGEFVCLHADDAQLPAAANAETGESRSAVHADICECLSTSWCVRHIYRRWRDRENE